MRGNRHWIISFAKYCALFLTGGLINVGLEILWRGFTHPAMLFVGGAAFLLVGGLNDWFSRSLSLLEQSLLGGTIITALELLSGLLLNRWLRLNIWDYSAYPFQLLGQICLPFWALWCLLAIAAIIVDDWLRHWLFGKERPHYQLLPGKHHH